MNLCSWRLMLRSDAGIEVCLRRNASPWCECAVDNCEPGGHYGTKHRGYDYCRTGLDSSRHVIHDINPPQVVCSHQSFLPTSQHISWSCVPCLQLSLSLQLSLVDCDVSADRESDWPFGSPSARLCHPHQSSSHVWSCPLTP